MKRTTLVLALAALAVVSVSAQDRMHNPDPNASEARKELIGSLKQFATTDILPQLSLWKGQLDAAMAPEDLQQLNGLRARATALHEKGIGYVKAMREAWRAEDYNMLKANRTNLKNLAGEQKMLMEELKPLAMKYTMTLITLGESAKPKVQIWKTQGKEIYQNWLARHKDQVDELKGELHGMMRGFGWMGGHGNKGMRQKMMVARFMLWDGSNFINKLEQFGSEEMDSFDLK